MYFICLPYHVFYIEVMFQCSIAMPSQFPNHTRVCCLSYFYTYSASIQFYIQLVFFLLCCPVVSLALTLYSLRPDYMLPKWIKKDVSRTEIRLDPSIYFQMEGIHVNMSCLSILQYLFHLSAIACFIIKALFFYIRHARGRRLCQNLKGYKQGLCKRSKRQEIINQLQFLQILLQHRETQLLLIISRFQWPKNQSAPVQQKYVNSILRSVCVSLHHEILQHANHIFYMFLTHLSFRK